MSMDARMKARINTNLGEGGILRKPNAAARSGPKNSEFKKTKPNISNTNAKKKSTAPGSSPRSRSKKVDLSPNVALKPTLIAPPPNHHPG
ncbi:hypothetical protein TrLO_g6105 [Triparma laevis f. longispina]|uniref:Uncharacterized protein n=1 Tax=Triparma laevis f. longispina TaxID=1714387 RepID=A0A9W7CCI1_9STRA|nr:hypothetical protein TrLO_g6105 [Triparma laevis f. longispina]